MKLNREQIIKALECHANGCKCSQCPMPKRTKEHHSCWTELSQAILALFKEITEENESLHASCTELTQCCTKLEALYKIECKRVDTVKADTVRRMQSDIQEACLKGGIWPAFVAGVVKGVGEKILEENNDN